MATWAGQNSDVRFLPAGIAGFAGGNNVNSAKYTAACAVRGESWRRNPDCQSWHPLNFVSYAFSGCETCCDAKGQNYTESSDWPAEATATWPGCSASPYRFVELGRNFSMDERWYNAYFEASHYSAVSQYQLGSTGERYEWLGTLGTLLMLRWDPVINIAGFIGVRFNRTYIYQSDLSTYSGLRRVNLARNMAHRLDLAGSRLRCFPAVDEVSFDCPGCGWLGSFKKSGIVSYVQISQIFSFWQRGVAYFSSVAVGNVNVQLRIILCRVGGTVALPIMEHVASLAPAGEVQLVGTTTGQTRTYYHTTNANGILLENREPTYGKSSRDTEWLINTESLPVAGTAHAMVADGRLEPGGPLVYHAILRIPFFPPTCKFESCRRQLCQPFCVVTKQPDLDYPCAKVSVYGSFDDTVRGVCPDAVVKHVIALWSWNVVGTSASLRRAPVRIAERSVPHKDSCIVQNGHVGEAGAGIGALEGKFVEGHGRPFSYYVLGDEIVRLRRPGTFESGIGGEVSGRLRLQPEGWAPSLGEWYSVRAAVYSRGSLFVVRQRHTAEDTDCQQYLQRDIVTTGFSNRMRSILRPSFGPVELLKIENVEGEVMGPVRVAIRNFYKEITGGYVTDNLGAMDSFDYRSPFPETPYIVLYNKQPARVIKIYTDCPAGQAFNAPSVFGDSVGDNCVPLPPGLYSNRTGVISEDEADVCPTGTFSEEGATSCTACPAGTYSERGAGSCYECPQNTFSQTPGTPCAPCPANAFTQTKKWTSECAVCEPGTYLPYTGATVCLACPAQTWAPRGTLGSCLSCEQGAVPSADASHCEKCPAGTYQKENRTACILCPELTFTSSAGTFGQCTPCSPGTVSVDARTECRACLPGYFSYGAECLRCFGNSIAPEAGRSNCTECPRGQVATEDKQNCIACPAGTFFTVAAGSDVATCEKCPINTITSTAGLDACTPCKLGEVAAADSQSCVPCGAGTYRAENMSACTPVPPRSVALQGAEIYTECAPGEVPSRAKTECLQCPGGSYQKNDTCERCPLNTVASAPGRAECTPCREGEAASADSQTCEPCQAGFYRTADMASCAVVPERAAALERSPLYVNCSAGWIPNLARSECTPCRAGYFQNQDVCERCPKLTVSSSEGSDRCTPCAAGYVTAEDQQSCIPCGVGTYRTSDMSVCTAVPHRAVALSGSSNYTECSPGAVPDSAKAQCVQCPAGSYQVGEMCERCPINTVSSLPAATNCTECLPGEFSATDSQTCIPCAAGTYRAANMPACLPVPPRAAALPGSPLYTNCSAGFVPNAAQSECYACAAGSYQDGDVCKRCPDLTIAAFPNSTVCAPCRPGTVPADDLQSCVPCGAGTYRAPDMLVCTPVPFRAVALHGSANYTNCSAGWIPDAAKAQCFECPAGSFQTGETCERCALNSVTGSPGQTSCRICDLGYVSASDSQTCLPCPVGTYRGAGMDACTPVPERAAALQGSSAYTACDPGSVPNAALSECLACPAGSYQVGDVCLRCPELSVASSPGSTSCRACDLGQVPADDLQSCADCPAGTFRGANASVCENVPWRAVALPGSANYTACRPGAIPDTALAQCVDCPGGSYQVGDACERCPVNSVTSSPGLAACTLCLEGFVSSSDSQLCLPCRSGTFRATGNTTCLPVPVAWLDSLALR
eukprot:tig00020944_g16352.t1